jgi:hypothetical protein
MSTNFRFRCLVVEDEKEWFTQMRETLGRSKDLAVDIVVAPDAAAARREWRRGRFQAMSFDLRIPAIKDQDAPEPMIGADLFDEAFFPLTAKAVYSAYLETDAGDKSRFNASRRHTPYFTKSMSGLANFAYTPRLSAMHWADFVAARLLGTRPSFCTEEPAAATHWLCRDWGRDRRAMPYLALYWLEAGKFLPPPLSFCARHIETALGALDSHGAPQAIGLDAVHGLNQFREWALHLAWTQSVVLMRRSGRPIATELCSAGRAGGPRTPTEPLHRKARDLQAWLNDGALDDAPSWRAHLRWREEGQLDFLAASQGLREWRNRIMHGRPKPDHRGDWASIRAPLLTVMDAAAYWANAWLYADPRSEAGRWQGSRLMGGLPPWNRHDLGAVDRHPPGPRDSVFQRVWVTTGDGAGAGKTLGAVILDWSPWLFMAIDEQTGYSVPWLLTHPVEGQGARPTHWYAICLTETQKVRRKQVDFDTLFGRQERIHA